MCGVSQYQCYNEHRGVVVSIPFDFCTGCSGSLLAGPGSWLLLCSGIFDLGDHSENGTASISAACSSISLDKCLEVKATSFLFLSQTTLVGSRVYPKDAIVCSSIGLDRILEGKVKFTFISDYTG